MPSTERRFDRDQDPPDTDTGFGGLVRCDLCGGFCDSIDDYCRGCNARVCQRCDQNQNLFGSRKFHEPEDHETKASPLCVACGDEEALGSTSLVHPDLCPSCASEADGRCFTCNRALDECRCGVVDPDFDSV